jgi:hypothetical protein
VKADGATSRILSDYLDAGAEQDRGGGRISLHKSLETASAALPRVEILSGEDLEIVLTIRPFSPLSIEEIFVCLIDGTGKYVCRGTLGLANNWEAPRGKESTCRLAIRDLRLKSGMYQVQILALCNGGKTQLLDLVYNRRVRVVSRWVSKVEYQPLIELL